MGMRRPRDKLHKWNYRFSMSIQLWKAQALRDGTADAVLAEARVLGNCVMLHYIASVRILPFFALLLSQHVAIA